MSEVGGCLARDTVAARHVGSYVQAVLSHGTGDDGGVPSGRGRKSLTVKNAIGRFTPEIRGGRAVECQKMDRTSARKGVREQPKGH